MRWAALSLTVLLLVLVGCRTWEAKNPVREVQEVFDCGHSITLEEYLANKRELNEKYLYGSPMEALKALESTAQLEERYAKDGQRPIDSNHARLLAYSRLFVLSERLRQRPEAEEYLAKAQVFALKWKPELSALPPEKLVDFIRSYVDEFEKGLVVRWKSELK